MGKGEKLQYRLNIHIEAQSPDTLEPDTEYFMCDFYPSCDSGGTYQGFTSMGNFIKYKYFDDSPYAAEFEGINIIPLSKLRYGNDYYSSTTSEWNKYHKKFLFKLV
jgi:hypothetical protein